MTFDPGTGQVPPSTPAAGAEPAAPVPQPVSATVHPVDAAPRVPPPQPPKPARSAGRVGAASIVLAIGLLVAVGGVAFAVGRVTAPASSAAASTRTFGGGANGNGFFNGTGTPNGSFAPGQSGNRALGGFGGVAGLTGTVTAITTDNLTLQIGGTSGRTIEIPLISSTTYHTQTPATAADVTVGAQVIVRTQRVASTTGVDQPNGQGGQGQPNGQFAQPSGAPGNGAAPGGGQPNFTIGPATDVTVLPAPGQ